MLAITRPTRSLARRAARPRRRGLALLMVMMVLALATIITYATLASAALASTSSAHARAATVARLAAESGATLAMLQLLRPENSTVPLVAGDAGDVHYPGQSGVVLDEGVTFDVAVTNPAPATYTIRSVGRCVDGEGQPIESIVEACVVGVGKWKTLTGGQFAGEVRLSANADVRQGVSTQGNFLEGAASNGTTYAANYASNAGWVAPPALPQMVVPQFGSMAVVRAARETRGYYVYGDQLCRADFITSNKLSATPSASAANVGRVFIYDGTAPLELWMGQSTQDTFSGTLVVNRAQLYVMGNVRVLPSANLPAMLVNGTTNFTGAVGELHVDGLAYFNGDLVRPTGLTSGVVRVEGCALVGDLGGARFGAAFNGSIRFRRITANVALVDLTNQGIRYDRMQIEDWRHVTQ